jgi:uroporphyrin-III C-methyltransferase/precorrin-2 dehydrogenase/sirohydrochlorin ferrochelatase
MHSLPLFLKIAGQPVILIGEGEAADAKRRLIERAGGIPVGEGDASARIAFVALEDFDAAADAAARLKARGLLVNVVDQPALCDFTTPAIVDRDPVLIAVATGGASAGLAKAIRQRIERLLPQSLGKLADALGEARAAMRTRWPEPRARRLALDAAIREGGLLDPLADHAHDAVPAWLANATHDRPDRTEAITLASADPDELSLRAARMLGEADRIIHAGDIPDAILARARADAVRLVLPRDATVPDAAGLTLILRITGM